MSFSFIEKTKKRKPVGKLFLSIIIQCMAFGEQQYQFVFVGVFLNILIKPDVVVLALS